MNATLIGFGAVLLWAALAALTEGAEPVPPFQLNALAFALGGLIGLPFVHPAALRLPARVWLLGVGGLFGYHFFYFTALRLAPAAQAGLIAYLWPLLIVLFSGLLPGERLRAGHILGAGMGLAGAAILIGGGGGGTAGSAAGYGAAILCALIWSGYSVLSRVVGSAPTSAVAVFCLAASALSALAHLALETTVWPDTALGWASVAGLGFGPVGLAFYLWDWGVKRGNIQLLGVSSYAAPLLSTLLLIGLGLAPATPALLLAALLIAGGAGLAALSGPRAGGSPPSGAASPS